MGGYAIAKGIDLNNDAWEKHKAHMEDLTNEARRNTTLAERRELEANAPPTQMVTVGSTPADLQAALGHWADDAAPASDDWKGDDRFLQPFADEDQNSRERRLASHHIHNHYTVNSESDASKDNVLLPRDTKLDLSSPEARLRSLNNLSQIDPNNAQFSNITCGASALLGAALLAGGKTGYEGLDTLMAAMEHSAGKDEGKNNIIKHKLAAIREKQKAGEQLTIADMNQLQTTLYGEMEAIEGDNKAGLQQGSIQRFIDDNPQFKKMMADNHMGLEMIDASGGKQQFAHEVLTIGGDGPRTRKVAIYDPQTRDAGQIITDPNQLADYERARGKDREGHLVPDAR